MAITMPTGASELRWILARAARQEPLAKEVWITTRRDGVHIWLLIERASDDEERGLYELLDLLDKELPGVDFQLHVLNPASYVIDLHDVLPGDAEMIFARAA